MDAMGTPEPGDGGNEVRVHGTGTRPVGDLWPLLALRYLTIACGVSVWLWEAERTVAFAVSALLFSLVLLLDLSVYGGVVTRRRSVWAFVQTGCALVALIARPGVPAALILAAVLAGGAATVSWPGAAASLLISGAVTAVHIAAPIGVLAALLILYVMAVAAGRFFALRAEESRRHKVTVEELEKAQARVAEYAEATRELSAARERQRLAEELHDTLGHALVGALLQVQVAQRLLRADAGEAEARLARVERDLRGTLEKVRHALRRGAEKRDSLPLHLAIESLAADFAAAGGPDVQLVFRPDAESVSDVGPEVTDALYRVVQEALTNAVRHGKATHIVVAVEAVGPRLFVRVSDNGAGADQYTLGMGLSGMIGRVQAVGGTVRFETAPRQGFTVEVGVRRR